MNNKNYAEVLIDGKIYTLGGAEDQQYLQRVAGYITEKTVQLKRQEGFSKQSQEYQAVMVELNIADDYFKATDRAEASDRRMEDMERETYSLKHELVMTQMNLERREQDLDAAKQNISQLKKQFEQYKSTSAEELAAARTAVLLQEQTEGKLAAAEKELAETKAALEKERAESDRKLEEIRGKLEEAKNALEEQRQKQKADQEELLKLKALQAAYSQTSGGQGYSQNPRYNPNYNNRR